MVTGCLPQLLLISIEQMCLFSSATTTACAGSKILRHGLYEEEKKEEKIFHSDVPTAQMFYSCGDMTGERCDYTNNTNIADNTNNTDIADITDNTAVAVNTGNTDKTKTKRYFN